MTLRIEDGKRVYEFVAQVSHKKKEFVIIEAMQQVLLSLWSGDEYITNREDRKLANLEKALKRLRKIIY